ncbi:glycosyltransferase family 2 protein [Acinetobacter larvae]|uniref:Glycosyltransferase 2-like domain-containing protein n=1 Tax=Acinetobacter larvae TaxID=1789224 RepID=A0A1B2LVQ1_9GAMM|nr:glycosyltransferase [Acinetobacter larvae]AOA56995.1 hypothetical protein BFG52_00560 [Acinetobacter larvae]
MLQHQQALVSVIIPCYNHEQFVQDSINSVIAQDYANIELIIIDDGSQDQSAVRIQALCSQCQQRFSRFEYRCRPNKGLSATLNEALAWCQGEYFAILASDDKMLATKISSQTGYLAQHPHVAVVVGGVRLIDVDDQVVGQWHHAATSYQFQQILRHQHEIPAPTALLRRADVLNLGGYKDGILLEDWYMWLKLTIRGREIHYLDQIYCDYRHHANNISKNLPKIHAGRQQILNEFQNHPDIHAATLRVAWINAADYLRQQPDAAMRLYGKLFIQHPIFFILQLFDRLSNRFKRSRQAQ